jgi:iron complex outermembrane recepter protein
VPQHLANAIATGNYSISNPEKNTAAQLAYVQPVNNTVSTSKLWEGAATLGRTITTLPGGPLQAVAGLQYRWESINNPSANGPNPTNNFERYYNINAISAVGSRTVKSALYEIDAPIFRQLQINASGRYDDYSSGQKNFSPKFEGKFIPIPEVTIRGNWSKGFRIPSINEAYGLPVVGYVYDTVDCTKFKEYCDAHGNNNYAKNQYSIGVTAQSDPALKPEKSTSWGAGIVFEPIHDVTLSVDYWNIKIDGLIGDLSAGDRLAALAGYYGKGETDAVKGVTVVPGNIDVNYRDALPAAGYVVYTFRNENSQRVNGIDFALDVNRKLGPIRWISSLDASFIMKYDLVRADGSVERYDGTLSPSARNSGSGTPKWRGAWSNALIYEKAWINITAYFTDGYDLASVDTGGVAGDCKASIGQSVATYQNGDPVQCRVGPQWNADLSFGFDINDRFALYGTVSNFLGIKPVFIPGDYTYGYNTAWSYANAIGRSFRAGVRVNF